MTACLAPQEIARYRAGEFETEAELLAVEEHLDGCPSCRRNLLAEISAATPALRERLTSPLAVSACPEPALLARYVEGSADATDIELVQTHCEECSRCAQDLVARIATRPVLPAADSPATPSDAAPLWLQRLRGLFLPNGLPAHPAIAAFALVLVAALGSLAVYRGRVLPLEARYQAQLEERSGLVRQIMAANAAKGGAEKRLRQSDQVRTEQETRLKQMDVRVRDLERRLSQLPQVPSAGPSVQMVAAVEQALVTRRITIDPQPQRLLALVQREQSQARGGSTDPSSPTLLQPVGTLVLEDRPTLRWKPGTGAQTVIVTVRRVADAREADPNEEQKGANVTDTTWTVPKALQRGKRYRWQIATPEGRVSAIGEFLVVDTQTAETLRHTAQEYSGQHLTLGILYTKAGLLGAAEAELTAIPQTDPKFATAHALLQNLRTTRARTGSN